jgi:O-antigen/teichoic acid export membrane protein
LKDFAMYSFSVSLLSIIYLFITAISTVIYPYLARANKDKLNILFFRMKFLVLIAVGLSVSVYFMLEAIVIYFVPNYIQALNISSILFITVLFRSQVDLVSRNFYKVMKLQKDYTTNNITAFIVGLVTSTICFLVFKSTVGMAIAAVITFFIWMIYTDFYFIKKLNINNIKRLHILEILTIIMFYSVVYCFNWYIGLFLYPIIFVIFVILFYKDNLISLIKNKKDYFKV